jgi:UDP-N-acetylmuramoyl-tripeptide--D-alanyl-D-alanine ligase
MSLEFNPEKLAAWAGGRWTRPPALPLTGFAVDSRRVGPRQMFVALKTEKRDGHDFLAGAAAAGAGGAVVSHSVAAADLPQLVATDPLAAFQAIAAAHRREFSGPVVGVSGSAGKTSTKDLLGMLLGQASAGTVLATEGNLNNHLGVPLTLTRLDPAIHRHAVIEAGIGAPGEMAPLAAMISPDIAIITLVAPAHLAGLGTLEGVAREKAGLAAAVRAGGLAIFPASCLEFAAFRELKVRALVVTRTAGALPADRPRGGAFFTVESSGPATRITLAAKGPPAVFSLPSVSDGMTQNAALALCAALELGVAPEVLQARLADWHPGSLRGELRRAGDRLLYLDCYNANPASMADALDAFYSIAPKDEPRLFVIGGMEELGAAADRYHAALGRGLRLRAADFLFVIGEQASAVRRGALAGGADADQIQVVDSIGPIAERLEHFRGAVFVKGSRRYQLEKILEAGGLGRPVESHA